jgi:hypothetical protein
MLASMQGTMPHGSFRGTVVKWPPSRTLLEEIRHSVHEHAKWTGITVCLSLVGAVLALNAHYAGQAFSQIIQGAFITLLSGGR